MAFFSQGDPSPGSCRGREFVMLCGAHHLQKCFWDGQGVTTWIKRHPFHVRGYMQKTKDFRPVTACSQFCSKRPHVLTEISTEQCNTCGRASFSLQPCFKTTQLGQERILILFNLASCRTAVTGVEDSVSYNYVRIY